MYEYKTTFASFALEGVWTEHSGRGYFTNPAEIPDPVVPEGDGWEMVGSTADRSMLFWFWRRKV